MNNTHLAMVGISVNGLVRLTLYNLSPPPSAYIKDQWVCGDLAARKYLHRRIQLQTFPLLIESFM